MIASLNLSVSAPPAPGPGAAAAEAAGPRTAAEATEAVRRRGPPAPCQGPGLLSLWRCSELMLLLYAMLSLISIGLGHQGFYRDLKCKKLDN